MSDRDGVTPGWGERFPRSVEELGDRAKCPACFAVIEASPCKKCGLNLLHPATIKLGDVSSEAARLMDYRATLLRHIRDDSRGLERGTHREVDVPTPAGADAAPLADAITVPPKPPVPPITAAAASAAPIAEVAAPPRAPVVGAQPSSSPRPPVHTAPVHAAPVYAAPVHSAPRESRRPSAQVLLLGVGVTLLAIAAIFFMIYAFVTFGLLVRALIIGAITVGAIVGATLVRRRALFGTAEAIAALAVILILLDVWAIRANALMGLDRVEPDLYWGIALVVAAAGLRVWQARSGLRVPGLSGAFALPLGAALTAGGLSAALESQDALMLAAVAAALAALAHPLFAPKDAPASALPAAQRIILLAWAVLGLAVAVATVPAVAPNAIAAPTLALVALAAIVAVHAVVLAKVSPKSSWVAHTITVAVAAVAALLALSPAAFALRVDNSFTLIALPLLGAAGIALIAELLQRRSAWGHALSAAPIVAGVIALLFSLLPVGVLAVFASTGPIRGVRDPRWLPLDGVLLAPTTDVIVALAAVAFTVAVTAVVWLRVLALRSRRVLVLAAAALVLTLAAPLLGMLWAVVAAWLVFGAAALWWLLRRPGRLAFAGTTRVIAASAVVNVALGYLASWAGEYTWLLATVIVIALLLVARRLFARTQEQTEEHDQQTEPVWRAALLGIAAGLAFVGVAGVGGIGIGVSLISGFHAERDTAVGMLVLAIVVLIAVALPLGTLVTSLDRRVLFWLAAIIGIGSALAVRLLVAGDLVAGDDTPAWLPLLLSLGLLAALLVWSFAPMTRGLRVERIVAAIAVAPALSWVLESFAAVLNLADVLGPVVPTTAALLVSAAALVGSLRSTPIVPRWFSDAGVWAVMAGAFVGAAVAPSELAWLAVLIAALTVLVQSVSADGLFGSQSPRRNLGWAAFALATAALWMRLLEEAVTAVEPFMLPVAAVFVAIAVLVARASRRRGLKLSTVPPLLTLVGLLLALVPSALQGVGEPGARVAVITVLSAVLLFAAIFVPLRASLQPFALAATIAGAAGVGAAAIGRALFLTPRAFGGGEVELWLGVGCGVLFVAAIALLWRGRMPQQQRELVAVILLLVAGTAFFALELAHLVLELVRNDVDSGSQSSPELRAIVLMLVLAALHVAAALSRTLPSRALLTWLPLAYASVTGLVGLIFGLFDPAELATLPIALALLISGAHRMQQQPELRSWPGIGAGVTLLLVPSLLLTSYDNPLWRLLALGVASIAVMVSGIVLRLQAPFVMGAIVVLIHGIATFSPQIRVIYESTPWWLWVAIGGALLLFLGATYEKRARDLRRTIGRISALR